MAAVATGLISHVVGGLHAANSAGGFGTGNGLAGAIVAINARGNFVIGSAGEVARVVEGRARRPASAVAQDHAWILPDPVQALVLEAETRLNH